MKEYHSFSSNPYDFRPRSYFSYKGHIGRTVNLGVDPMPDEWKQAEVIYSEISWRVGYERFMQRAGAEGAFAGYLKGIRATIRELNIPAFLVGSVIDMKALGAERIVTIRFKTPARNDIAYCGMWGDYPEVKSHFDVLNHIKGRYKVVLDFSCGYLSIANVLLPECRFIVSDVNPMCVGGAYEKLRGFYGQTAETE